MSAPYSGNPNAVQAPSPAPGPGVIPILSLIQDADGNTAANLYQAWKVCADFIAYIQQQSLGTAFGDGTDGNVTLDGVVAAPSGMTKASTVYTLTRDFYANNLTVTGAGVILKTAGFRLFVRGTLTTALGGIISNDGNPATARIAGAAGSTGSLLSGAVGGNGGDGTGSAQTGFPGGVANNGLGGAGGAGGASGGGTNGGPSQSAVAPAAALGGVHVFSPLTIGHICGISGGVSTSTALQGGSGGSGGGASGPGAPGGTAGGGGGGGGVLVIAARVMALFAATDVHANGGAGANATVAGASGSGGGGGGGGGVAIIAYGSKGSTTFSAASNCAGGAGGAGIGTGIAGNAGTNGTLLEMPLT
jgi:hypothetical protein